MGDVKVCLHYSPQSDETQSRIGKLKGSCPSLQSSSSQRKYSLLGTQNGSKGFVVSNDSEVSAIQVGVEPLHSKNQ